MVIVLLQPVSLNEFFLLISASEVPWRVQPTAARRSGRFNKMRGAQRALHVSVDQGLNWAGSRRIPDPSPPSWDPAHLFGDPADPLELCSSMSLMVSIHHDSYKYAFKSFPFQHVALNCRFFFVNRNMWQCSLMQMSVSIHIAHHRKK